MDKVYKYPLLLRNGIQRLEIPEGSLILHFAMQVPNPTIWARVNSSPDMPMVERKFIIKGTGHDLGVDNLRYIGTTLDGSYVWHLFEIIEDKAPI